MSNRKTKSIDYESLESRDLVWLAQLGDKPAEVHLLQRKEEVMRRLVRNCVRKYTFVDPDDLFQSLVISFFRVVRGYRPGRSTDWDKYCYHRLTFEIKDILRQRDDLGIGWPQKKHYPDWFHLYDKSGSDEDVYANTISDHRQPSSEANEQLEFYESIELLRVAMQVSRCLPPSKLSRASTHDVHPLGWSGQTHKYSFPLAENQNRRKRVRLNLLQWRRERSRPKQMVMWK